MRVTLCAPLLALLLTASGGEGQKGSAVEERIRFAPGASAVDLSGRARWGTSYIYLLTARAGQRLTVRLTGAPSFAIHQPPLDHAYDGDRLAEGVRQWSGPLPRAGLYQVIVSQTRTGADGAPYTLHLALGEGAAAQREGSVCPNPARPCPGFRPHDLSFVVPSGGTARGEDRSAPFYAVILRSGARCSIPERDRRAAQALFPGRKVFSGRFECGGDVENNVTYTGVDARYGFLAVYAGDTPAAANRFLAQVRAGGRFRGANLRRMQAVRVQP